MCKLKSANLTKKKIVYTNILSKSNSTTNVLTPLTRLLSNVMHCAKNNHKNLLYLLLSHEWKFKWIRAAVYEQEIELFLQTQEK